jgi:hypothetical protein
VFAQHIGEALAVADEHEFHGAHPPTVTAGSHRDRAPLTGSSYSARLPTAVTASGPATPSACR